MKHKISFKHWLLASGVVMIAVAALRLMLAPTPPPSSAAVGTGTDVGAHAALDRSSLSLNKASKRATANGGAVKPASGTKLSAADLSQIGQEADLVLNVSADPSERRRNLHSLVERGTEALSALGRIAQTPSLNPYSTSEPHSFGEGFVKYEQGLRITALEAIDHMAETGDATVGVSAEGKSQMTTQITSQLGKVIEVQPDPMIRFMAQVSLSGIYQGRPGKLRRLDDKLLDRASN